MLLAFLLIAAMADWVPARWNSADPELLALLADTPVNCLLLERDSWSKELVGSAAKRNVAALGVIRPGSGAAREVVKAGDLGFAGVVFEGNFGEAGAGPLRTAAEEAGLKVVELPPRGYLDLGSKAPVIGTYQGVWAGIHTMDDGSAKAAPTGAPWIDTNTGFARFIRAVSGAALWIGSRPPEGQVIPPTRYSQAIGDAGMVGARWIVALDADLEERLFEREAKALAAWKEIGGQLRFWEEHREWTLAPPCGQLAIVVGAGAGGLLSNGILDMITARHIPLRTVAPRNLDGVSMRGARIAVNVDPPALSAAQTAALRQFARDGGMLLSAPPGWTFPEQRPDQVTVDDEDVEKLDDIWHGVNMTIGRENLGIRLFNVASMRSELVSPPGSRTTILHLVNYSDYPVENVTIRPLLHTRQATLHAPGREPEELEIFENGEIDIAEVGAAAIVVLEPLGDEEQPATRTGTEHQPGHAH